MKKSIKKNQIIIAALTVLLGVAGYINFSGNTIDLAKADISEEGEGTAEAAFIETEVDESAGEITISEVDSEESIELNSEETDIGEAVLASTDTAPTNIVNIRLNREQTRSMAKEQYLEIINGDNMDAAAVEMATSEYMILTENMEKETETETILSANGYENVVVSISDDSVDVVIGTDTVSDTDRAKIEDVVVRKTGCSVEDIIITPLAN